jgi:CHASE2 domain-containing sensor protein
VATNLGFVCIDESSIDFVRTNAVLGYNHSLYWPRHVYGRAVAELAAQGARLAAFDVIFPDLRPDDSPVPMTDDSLPESDEYFALQMARARNVALAFTQRKPLPLLFRTNALALGHVLTERDHDGVVRRARAFVSYRQWHPASLQVQADPGYGVNLDQARVERGQVVLPRLQGDVIKLPLDQDGNFDLADFYGDKLPAGAVLKYTTESGRDPFKGRHGA